MVKTVRYLSNSNGGNWEGIEMDFLRRGLKVLLAIGVLSIVYLMWGNSTCKLKLQIGDVNKFVELCKVEADAMKQAGVELVDGRECACSLRFLSPQFITLRQDNIMDIQLRGGFAHKGLLVDIDKNERPSLSHAKFGTRKILARVYLYSEL